MPDPTPAERFDADLADTLATDTAYHRRLDRIAAMDADHPGQEEPAWLGPVVLGGFAIASIGALAAVIGRGWW